VFIVFKNFADAIFRITSKQASLCSVNKLEKPNKTRSGNTRDHNNKIMNSFFVTFLISEAAGININM